MIRYFRDLIDAGQFKPVIDRTYSLEQIVDAYRYVETGRKSATWSSPSSIPTSSRRRGQDGDGDVGHEAAPITASVRPAAVGNRGGCEVEHSSRRGYGLVRLTLMSVLPPTPSRTPTIQISAIAHGMMRKVWTSWSRSGTQERGQQVHPEAAAGHDQQDDQELSLDSWIG